MRSAPAPAPASYKLSILHKAFALHNGSRLALLCILLFQVRLFCVATTVAEDPRFPVITNDFIEPPPSLERDTNLTVDLQRNMRDDNIAYSRQERPFQRTPRSDVTSSKSMRLSQALDRTVRTDDQSLVERPIRPKRTVPHRNPRGKATSSHTHLRGHSMRGHSASQTRTEAELRNKTSMALREALVSQRKERTGREHRDANVGREGAVGARSREGALHAHSHEDALGARPIVSRSRGHNASAVFGRSNRQHTRPYGSGRHNTSSSGRAGLGSRQERWDDQSPLLTPSDFATATESLPSSSWLTKLRRGIDHTGRDHEVQSTLPGSTCRQFNWTETAAVQAFLHRHQNPVDCASAKFLVYHPRRSGGLAALLTQLKNALTVGLMTGRVVILFDANGWPLVDPHDCGNRTFDCLFLPLSQCRLTAAEQLQHAFYVTAGVPSSTDPRRIVHGTTGVNGFSKHVPRAFGSKDQFWWLAQAMFFLFQPRQHTLESIRAFAASQHWDAQQRTVALHLRSADRGKNYIGPLLEYVRRDPVLSKADRVFVATDDKEAVRTLISVSGDDAEHGGLYADVVFDRKEDRRQHVVEDILNSPAKVNATELTFEAIKNVALLASGQYFVGTQDSGFSEVAAALGCVAGHVDQEPLVFEHWKKDQDPSNPPVSVMGSTYYQGPGLEVGQRAQADFNPFNKSDFGMHSLSPTGD